MKTKIFVQISMYIDSITKCCKGGMGGGGGQACCKHDFLQSYTCVQVCVRFDSFTYTCIMDA